MVIGDSVTAVKGVGEKTRTALLAHFKSLKRLREASEAEVAAVVGPAKARIVVAALSDAAENGSNGDK